MCLIRENGTTRAIGPYTAGRCGDLIFLSVRHPAGIGLVEEKAQMKADAAARRDDIKAKIDERTNQLDAKAAAADADWAEQDALDAIDYAALVVQDAQLAVLDALDARAYADERARIAS